MNNPVEQFRDAMAAAGLPPPDSIIESGKIERFSASGKPGDTAGWYIYHGDKIPAGSFGSWREGSVQTWCSIERTAQTPEQRQICDALLRSMRNARYLAKKAEHNAAAKTAAAIWAAATPISEQAAHGYLAKKGIQPHGTRLIDEIAARKLCPKDKLLSTVLRGPLLVIPMQNVEGELRSLQLITAIKTEAGDKRPLTGGEKQGCMYLIGATNTAMPGAIVIVCEGFATGASIHEATRLPVAVAFDAGNLEPVCKALRKASPDTALIVAADDDHLTDGNPGQTKAKAAALAVGGVVVLPRFPAGRGDKDTDFNDLHMIDTAHGGGLDVVRACFAGAIESIADSAVDTGASGMNNTYNGNSGMDAGIYAGPEPVQALATDLAGTPDHAIEVVGADADDAPELPAGPFPGMDERPRYVVLDDWTESKAGRLKPGVYYCGVTAGKKDAPPEPFNLWFCSPLHIEALTFDGQNNNYGRLLRFKPTAGKWREWAMPMELLAGDGVQLRGELLSMGVELDPYKARQQLPQYLQNEHPKRRVHCALQVGWCEGSFVLPDTVIGPKAAGVIFQSGERGHEEHTQKGTLAGWKEGIAAKAVGNPLLMLALSASFAGPLLAKCNAEGGGFHIVGDSSTGKTTLIDAACSTWGGPGFKRSWRATANGMEGAAAMFNDCLLALDEISECDPKEVGNIVYALGNGQGKQRASRSGSARSVIKWRCFVISSGERTIATAMQEGGHRAKAGQAMRLLDIPIPAAQTYGAWNTLHGATSPAAFSDAIKRTAAQHHGQAGRAFLEKLAFDTTDFCETLEQVKASSMFATDGTEGQDKRAAARFALLGMAGELATEYGVTDWPVNAAGEAAAYAFKLWQSMRGKGNDERRQILQRVSDFIDRNGDGRFSDADSDDDHKAAMMRDRAGWWRNVNGGRLYLFNTDAMREATKGADFKRALDALQEAGALPAPGANGERSKPFRIAGRVVKLYAVDPDKLAGTEHGA